VSGAEKRAPVQGYTGGIPWSLHLRAYDAYHKKYGEQDALIQGGCRGGFSVGELDMFVPGWREEVAENTALRKTIADLEARLAASEAALRKAEERLDAARALNGPTTDGGDRGA